MIVDTFAEAYKEILYNVYHFPDFVSKPRNMEVKEILNYSITIKNIYSNLVKNEIRSTNKKYLAGELLWYFSKRNDVKLISRYSKFWNKIANEDDTCNSAYGYLLTDDNYQHKCLSEWNWAFYTLVKDKDSRQATIRFNKPWHIDYKTKDFPCTMYGIFHIRENKLYFSIYMRSSDSIKGTAYDIPFFLLLHQQMFNSLKNIKYNDLEIGDFTYNSNSQHIYESDYNLVKDVLNYKFEPDQLPKIENVELFNNFDLHKIIDNLLYNNNKELNFENSFIQWIYENSK
jgi:thymidylate synthase